MLWGHDVLYSVLLCTGQAIPLLSFESFDYLIHASAGRSGSATGIPGYARHGGAVQPQPMSAIRLSFCGNGPVGLERGQNTQTTFFSHLILRDDVVCGVWCVCVASFHRDCHCMCCRGCRLTCRSLQGEGILCTYTFPVVCIVAAIIRPCVHQQAYTNYV